METIFYECTHFDIDRKKLIYTSMPARHYHNAYEIFYMLSGEVYYFVEDRTYQLVRGDLLFVNMNQLHKMVNSSEAVFERVVVIFQEEFLNGFFLNNKNCDLFSSFYSDFNIVRLKKSDQNLVELLLDRMILEDTKKKPGYDYVVKAQLIELLVIIKRMVDSGKNLYYSGPASTHKKVFEIVNYINKNYYQQLSLNFISKNFFISPTYFSKIFKETTGFSFIEYLNSIRIKEARVLLRESKLKVSEIVEKVGFDNSTHFGRVFKTLTGYSPLKYRHLDGAE